MQTVIDLQKGCVVKQLFSPAVQPVLTGSAQDLNNAELSTNAILDVGAASGSATVTVQESDDQSTWSDVSGGSFAITSGTSANAVQVKRLLRTKRYARGVYSGTTAGVNFGLLVVGQKKYTYDGDGGDVNTGVDRSPSS